MCNSDSRCHLVENRKHRGGEGEGALHSTIALMMPA
jgi:hypothetical protein